MNFRRSIGPALALGLLIGVGMAITRSVRESRHVAARISVRVLTGPEKANFLNDSELAKNLDRQGIGISIEKADSGDIARRPDLKSFDVALLDDEDAALKIAQATHSKPVSTSLYTPMALASWKSLIPVLEASGLASRTDGSCYTIDMGKLVDMMRKGTRWKDLPQNSAYPVSKSVLIASTDVRKSDSGGAYLALASYVANGNNVVDSAADADKVADRLIELFSKQGFQESTAGGLFEDYTAMGIGKAPLVMIYEQQFLEYVLSHPAANPGMVLLYPAPTILARETLVPLSENGARFAHAFASNPEIDTIAQHYGFRTQDNAGLFAALQAKMVTVPHTIVDVIDLPRFDILDRLINRTETELSK
jgi:hypothetical protein